MGVADGLVPTLVTSDEMTHLTVRQFFAFDIALRLNGGVTRLFYLKLGLLSASVVPLILARPLPARRDVGARLSGIEKALAIRASNVAGLGRSPVYEVVTSSSTVDNVIFVKTERVQPVGDLALNAYEVVRLGYIVYGGEYLIFMDDWDRVSILSVVQHLYHLWNHRVVVLELRASGKSPSVMEAVEGLTLLRVDAPELQRVGVWRISSCSLSC